LTIHLPRANPTTWTTAGRGRIDVDAVEVETKRARRTMNAIHAMAATAAKAMTQRALPSGLPFSSAASTEFERGVRALPTCDDLRGVRIR
jgi:hypothetical protein